RLQPSRSNQQNFDNSSQRSRSLATSRYKKIKTVECHPYKKSTEGLNQRPCNLNFAENKQEIFVMKHKDSCTNVAVILSTPDKSNFEHNNIAGPSTAAGEQKISFQSLKEKTQFKEITARHLVTSSIANVSTSFTTANNIENKEISTPSEGRVLVEKNILSSVKMKRNFKPIFMAKANGTQNIYDKFADAHELEDIL
ncbi:unnamed protein product, partial [Meganyctiphanes norvegica]